MLSSFRRRIEVSYTALTALDGATARVLARQRAPDLAIIDVNLGRESGIDVMRSLKSEHPSAIMVLISGWVSIDRAILAVRAGADHVIQKPVTFPEILSRISGVPQPEAIAETPTFARAEWEHISRVLTDSDGNCH